MTSTTAPTAAHTTTRPTGVLRHDLTTGWTVTPVAGPALGRVTDPVPATVPGSVHTDLLAAGVIADPYLDDNESAQKWIAHSDWRYETTFEWTAGGQDRHDLVLEGVDTVATVEVNGVVVAEPRNMHRSYRVDVGEHLHDGENRLVVTFASAVRYADAQSLALGYRPQVNHHPFNAIRKMACSFGWDWGIDTATSGLWKPVAIESWSTARLASVRPVVTVDVPDGARAGARGDGVVEVHVEIERAQSSTEALDVVARVGEAATTVTVPAGESCAVVRVEVPQAELWWPRGYGEQPLYDAVVSIRTEADRDEWAGRLGFREVGLRMEPDAEGTSFDVVVNGRTIWVKGANWIPDDAFPHRVTRERYAARIAQAESANMNLLRVWGGGIYEADDFYELCDERGMLTWQDFLFACAAYAEEDPLRSEVEAEVRENVTRLAHHASLVLWNGSNENIWGWHDWGWPARLDGRTWGLGYYTDLIPAILGELDPHRPYTPSSPWSGSLDVHPNDVDHGSMHSWELWNRLDWPHYRDLVPRFMAEFGWQGPPTWSTLTRSISDDPLTPESPGMQVHQKAMTGNDKLTDGLVAHVPMPDDMDDWHWAMSWNQAVAIRTAITHLRSFGERCTGSVVWQLNDCWPVVSWAAVDGDGHAKPLLHALRQAYADRLVTVQPRSADGGHGTGSLAVVLHNDTDEAWGGELRLRRVRGVAAGAGDVLAEKTVAVDVGPRGVVQVEVPAEVAEAGDAATEVVVATLDGARDVWFHVEPRDATAGTLEATAERDGRDVVVRVTAHGLVRDVTLLVDKVVPSAEVERALVTLLPGETAEFRVSGAGDAAPEAFCAPTVLRHVGQLVGGAA
ncbi:beta-mannosidase [Paraoerskovia marina]|uniref:beta-mannosidase n=1 Tax=Paraoerskovia marina TaxID=545619 RepID=A0A1H1MMH5_9CELL|nr:glycoside hydrolase family 2 protein [Paraoerskovia marina]SDR87906.1 beta-mannosidase [Paraoerskovia marina]